jgi:hypothetical protein
MDNGLEQITGFLFAALLTWVAVRYLNRREEWAKQILITLLCMLAMAIVAVTSFVLTTRTWPF